VKISVFGQTLIPQFSCLATAELRRQAIGSAHGFGGQDMNSDRQVFLFLSPDVERLLADHDVDVKEVIRRTTQPITVGFGQDPATAASGAKDPVTILMASAAVIAAATPLIRELIRTLAGREPVIREKRLVPVEDSRGNVVLDSNGQATLHWVDEVKAVIPEHTSEPLAIKGFGIEISIGGD
jgi:hypothetical protein